MSFRDGLNTRSTWRFKALIMPMRANSGGPPLFCDQQQRFHRGLPFVGIVFRFRQFGDVLGGIAQRAQRLLSARQYDRIKKPLVP
ncbi:MAG TPA: hypothetical protein VK678_23090 [Bradyrhizobium sp.]|nr:hypothetical protein [Bradyrhizobium sp.]